MGGGALHHLKDTMQPGPRNPFLADSSNPIGHGRSDQQDNVPWRGPEGPSEVLPDDAIQYQWTGAGNFGQLISPVYPDGKSPKNDVVVIVRALVDEFGNVVTASATSGPAFKRKVKEAAVEAAKGATFQPAMKEGVAGRMYVDVKVVFPAR